MDKPGTQIKLSSPIIITPLSAAQAAVGLRQALEQEGLFVIPTHDASLYASARVCIVLMSPQTGDDAQVAAALSAHFQTLIPVISAPMRLPDAQWATEPFQLGDTDAQQRATGAAIVGKFAHRIPPSPGSTAATPAQPHIVSTAPAVSPVATQPQASAPMSAGGAQSLGALLGDYPGSLTRYIAIVGGVIFLFSGLTGWAFGGEWDTSSRWVVAFAGLAFLVAYYLKLRGAHAQVFEQGFIISRAGAETRGRWEDIKQVQPRAKQWYLLGLIPIPGTVSHQYIVHLRNGTNIEISGEYFRDAQQLAETIQKRWQQSPAARPSQSPSQ